MIFLTNPFAPTFLRLRLRPSLSSLRRLSISISISASRRFSNPDKHLQRAKSTLLKPSSANTLLSSSPLLGDSIPSLLPNQAIGFVASSQANFMRVIVETPGPDPRNPNEDSVDPTDPRIGTDLLCVVRALLKKIKRRVLVGDKVIVGSIDWTDKRGMIENVFANMDHLMVMFALDQPKLEPFNLTRFLVEAESSGIPLNLVVSKIERNSGELSLDQELSEIGRFQFGLIQREHDHQMVIVGSIDWTDKRGMIEDVFDRYSEVSDPPVANVDHLMVMFADQPKLEPFNLTRFLVEAVIVGSIDWTDKRGMIEDVFERYSEVSDPPVANVDHLMVMFALDQPKLEPFNLTRFLVEAESSGIPLSLVLNKAELVPEETLFDWKERLQNWGYKPLFCSVDKQAGLETVKEILKGQTTVIMGPSGVGKSSLINALRSVQDSKEGEEEEEEEDRMNKLLEQNRKWFGEQRVGTVSKKSGKGKHTTRHVSLLPLADEGFLADTPGFNQPNLMKVSKQNLPQLFPEIRNAIRESWPVTCAFNDCLHLGEPGCVMKGDWERYSYYLQLLDEIKIREEFQLRTFGTKRESEVRYKTGSMGVKQAEPRLNRKKHRRVSRKQLNQSVLDDLDDF